MSQDNYMVDAHPKHHPWIIFWYLLVSLYYKRDIFSPKYYSMLEVFFKYCLSWKCVSDELVQKEQVKVIRGTQTDNSLLLLSITKVKHDNVPPDI